MVLRPSRRMTSGSMISVGSSAAASAKGAAAGCSPKRQTARNAPSTTPEVAPAPRRSPKWLAPRRWLSMKRKLRRCSPTSPRPPQNEAIVASCRFDLVASVSMTATEPQRCQTSAMTSCAIPPAAGLGAPRNSNCRHAAGAATWGSSPRRPPARHEMGNPNHSWGRSSADAPPTAPVAPRGVPREANAAAPRWMVTARAAGTRVAATAGGPRL
mmetsp:Transcript_44794/g.124133  ORF Transcript_44794/g.124133 Transcript_44794/m.124133 type:complete len:213 (-) Transcript_44794:501-1139(-)